MSHGEGPGSLLRHDIVVRGQSQRKVGTRAHRRSRMHQAVEDVGGQGPVLDLPLAHCLCGGCRRRVVNASTGEADSGSVHVGVTDHECDHAVRGGRGHCGAVAVGGSDGAGGRSGNCVARWQGECNLVAIDRSDRRREGPCVGDPCSRSAVIVRLDGGGGNDRADDGRGRVVATSSLQRDSCGVIGADSRRVSAASSLVRDAGANKLDDGGRGRGGGSSTSDDVDHLRAVGVAPSRTCNCDVVAGARWRCGDGEGVLVDLHADLASDRDGDGMSEHKRPRRRDSLGGIGCGHGGRSQHLVDVVPCVGVGKLKPRARSVLRGDLVTGGQLRGT
mmetsp:Transcript_117008/g.174775  ORF Transcript_117008/g.174775 Transcript_117008/m.174775 type:complete len:332 (-) Transcript_117008:1290-2285(-)